MILATDGCSVIVVSCPGQTQTHARNEPVVFLCVRACCYRAHAVEEWGFRVGLSHQIALHFLFYPLGAAAGADAASERGKIFGTILTRGGVVAHQSTNQNLLLCTLQ